MAVAYNRDLALSNITKAVEATAAGMWAQAETPVARLLQEAEECVDEAAQLLSEQLEAALHPYVSDEDVAAVAAALAFQRLEGWDVAVDDAVYFAEQSAERRYEATLLQGDA